MKTLRQEIDAICKRDGGYPEVWSRHLKCPACGVGRLQALFEKYGFSHDRCQKCGFVCVNPYPPDAVLEKIYDGEYYTKVRELFEYPRLLKGGTATPFSAPMELLRDAINVACGGRERGAWLDVGGGLGAFASFIQAERPGWDVQLNEMNKRSAELALELYGLAGAGRDLGDFDRAGEHYDVISTVAVLEHVPEPLGLLRACMDLLNPGGCLVNIVPHFTRLNALVSQGSSPNVVPPYHVSLFNENSLKALLARLVGGREPRVEQAGDPSFNLMELVPFGDHWDVTIPTPDDPVPRSLQVKPYTLAESKAIAALAEAQTTLQDYFAEADGRLYLVSYLWKKE